MVKKKTLKLLLGPVLFVLCLLLLPSALFGLEAKVAIGTLFWMGEWWVTMPVHVGVTGFIPIVVAAIFNTVPMGEVLSNYSSDTVFLLLGANLLTLTWTSTGLDKRIALKFLNISGPSLVQQVLTWFIVAVVFALFLPNLVVCAMLTPIAFSMLKYLGEDDVKAGVVAPVILTVVAWGSGIGGMGTPFSGAMNLVAIEYIEDLIGCEYMYLSWIIRMIPLLICVVVANIVCILVIMPKGVHIKGSREYYKKLYAELPSMTRDEIIPLLMFLLAILMAFGRQFYAEYLPGLKPAYVFLILGVLTFIIPKKDGTTFNEWEDASKRIGWGLIFMIAGGMALGTMLIDSGAIDTFAGLMNGMNLTGGFVTMLVLTFFAVVISEISNHTAAAAICVPITISICTRLGINSMPYIYTVIAGYNTAYMMPTAVRAIPVGLGLDTKYLMKKGTLLTASTIIIIALSGYLLMALWPGFSGY